MRRLVIAFALALVPRLAHAQALACDTGDLELRSVEFTGNTHFAGRELGNAIVTTPSSWGRRVLHLPFGRRRCLDTLELQRDAVRLRLFYRQRGYYKTTVDTRVTPQGTGAVGVDFQIKEGPAVIMDSLTVTGLDSVARHEQLLAFLRPLKGHIFDKVRLQAAIDSVVDRLRNSGYARADKPFPSISVDYATNRATVELAFVPGRVAHIRDIRYVIVPSENGEKPRIPASTVRRLLSFHPGDVYQQRSLLRSQRDLYQTEAYRHVDVEVAPTDTAANDSLLTVNVSLVEAQMTSVRLGVGWATLDCARTQMRLINRDFFGGAHRLELTGRLSHIALCPGDVRADTFSNKLNYYGSGTVRLPALFGPRTVPSITLFSERTSEFQTYLRTVPIGGTAEITRDLHPRALRAGLPLTLAYRVEFGRTEAEPAVFCQLFNRCTLADIARLQAMGSLRVASALLVRDRSNSLLDPSRGSVVRAELRTGATSIDTGSANRFNRAYGEASIYRPTGGSSVLAARVQLGTVFEGWSLRGATDFVPPQERLYAGGANSVRGYNQNLLGPTVYVVSEVDSSQFGPAGERLYQAPDTANYRESPTGGNTLAVGNVEWRSGAPFLRDVLQLAAFVDAGLVWNRPRQTVHLGDLRVTPGVGARVQSPVGPLRVDVAYNRYSHASGPAYFASGTTLRCVSPGNDLDRGQIPAGSTCPASFTPQQNDTFFSRLTFHFSIGQAF